MLRRRRPPCERSGPDAFVLRLGEPEREVLVRLFGELDAMVAAADDVDAAPPANAGRLFPPAFTDHDGDDAEHDTEYQRLMRSELIASRRAAVAARTPVVSARRAFLLSRRLDTPHRVARRLSSAPHREGSLLHHRVDPTRARPRGGDSRSRETARS